MNIGIVGHESAKFTAVAEGRAREIIRQLLSPPGTVLVSGHCHLGGIDMWAEEEADRMGRDKIIYPPEHRDWTRGYKPRNILIAQASNVVHNIVVAAYPPGYRGMRFEFCYHCRTKEHIKSGGCWTAHEAERLGKLAYWHIIRENS